ncbi:MAG: hypothetical protein ACOYOO_12465 [Saprospiraceae bacterium]
MPKSNPIEKFIMDACKWIGRIASTGRRSPEGLKWRGNAREGHGKEKVPLPGGNRYKAHEGQPL